MKKEEGSVLVISFVTVLILLVIITGIVMIINNEVHIAKYEENKVKAFYIAEAGVEYASIVLADDDSWDEDGKLPNNVRNNLGSLTGGTIDEITKEKSGDEITVTCKARYGNINKSITKVFKLTTSNSSAFDHSFITNEKSTVNGSTEVIFNGDVYINNNFNNNGTTTFNGNYNINKLSSNNGTIKDSTGSVVEDIEESDTKNIIPDFNLADLKQQASVYNKKKYFLNDYDNGSGKNNIQITLNNEIVYLSDSFNPGKSCYIGGNGILIVNNLQANGNAEFYLNKNENDNVILIAEGNIHFNYVEANGLIYSLGHIHMQGNISPHNSNIINGTLLSEGEVHYNQNTTLTHNNSYLQTFTDLGLSIPQNDTSSEAEIKVIRWLEN